MYTPIDSIDGGVKLLGLIAARQKLLSSNLSNMDTPNYSRQDISFSQFLAPEVSPLETKLSQKMGTKNIWADINGEKVDVGKELAEMQKNYLTYTLATRKVSSTITQMRTVINMGQ